MAPKHSNLLLQSFVFAELNKVSMSVILDAGGIYSDGRNIHVFTN